VRNPFNGVTVGIAEDLEKLKTLRDQGALTEDEFILAKRRVIDGEPAPIRARAETPPPPSALREFRRSLRDKWIGGVCGGLDDITSIPAWSWRILFVLLALLHGIGIVIYVLLWIFVPLQKLALPAPTLIITPPPPSAPPAQ
jgi:phage shock protein C